MTLRLKKCAADVHHLPVLHHGGRPVGVLVEGEAVEFPRLGVEAIGVCHGQAPRLAGQPLLGGGGGDEEAAVGQPAAIADVKIRLGGGEGARLGAVEAQFPKLQAPAVRRVFADVADLVGAPVQIHAGEGGAGRVEQGGDGGGGVAEVGEAQQSRGDVAVGLHLVVAGHAGLPGGVVAAGVRPHLVAHGEDLQPLQAGAGEDGAAEVAQEGVGGRLVAALGEGVARDLAAFGQGVDEGAERGAPGPHPVDGLPIVGQTGEGGGVDAVERAGQAALLRGLLGEKRGGHGKGQDEREDGSHGFLL